MIAVIGKIGVGKTTFLSEIKKMGYKVFNSDEFIKSEYKTDGLLYKAIKKEFGTLLLDEFGVNKEKIRQWIKDDIKNLDLLEKCIYPIIFDHLNTYCYDFAEVPNLITKNGNFAKLFKIVLCLETSEKNQVKNLKKRNVNKLTIRLLNSKNDPKLIKNQLFKEKIIVDIYGQNFKNWARNKKFLECLFSLL